MQKGFTLIEIMVAMSIFIVVMTISLGAILGIFTDNSTAQQIKTSMDNVNSGLETMSRELRFGTQWHCGAIGSDITAPQECQSLTPGTQISFLSSDGYRTVYRLSGTAIQKSLDAGVTFVPITSSEVNISQFTLVVVGLGTGYQPKAYIFVRGAAGTTHPSMFTLQSIVSQRVLNTGSFTPTQGGSASSCSDTGLLGCWLFEEGANSTVVDSSGNGHAGTLFGNASWTTQGHAGNAVSLPGNGSTDEVDINGIDIGSHSVTVSAWFKLNGSTEATMSNAFDNMGATIFDTRQSDGNVSPTLMVTSYATGGNSNLGVAFICDTSASAQGVKGVTSLVFGQWYHAVGVYTQGSANNFNDGTWDVYLNGNKDNTSSNNLMVGTSCHGSFSGSTWFVGQAPLWPGESSIVVDNLRVYNRALSAQEISVLP